MRPFNVGHCHHAAQCVGCRVVFQVDSHCGCQVDKAHIVGASAAVHGIVAKGAAARVNDVAALATENGVVASAADQGVITGTATEGVISGIASDGVIASPARQAIGAGISGDRVIAIATCEGVIVCCALGTCASSNAADCRHSGSAQRGQSSARALRAGIAVVETPANANRGSRGIDRVGVGQLLNCTVDQGLRGAAESTVGQGAGKTQSQCATMVGGHCANDCAPYGQIRAFGQGPQCAAGFGHKGVVRASATFARQRQDGAAIANQSHLWI